MLQIYDDQHRRIAGINDPDDLKIEKHYHPEISRFHSVIRKQDQKLKICGLNIISGQKMMNMF